MADESLTGERESLQPDRERAEQQEDAAPPLWEVVPLSDYERPERPTKEAVRSGLLGLFKRKHGKSSPDEPVVAEDDVLPVPEDVLERAAPWPDWRQTVPALDRGLPASLESALVSHRLQAVVGAPYSGVRESLRCWAAAHRWPVVEPPAAERILVQDEGWLAAIPEDAEGPPILVAELEHCFLRHPLGLDFVRRLLERLQRSARTCLIATNSWTWTYLTTAVGIADTVATPFTFQAFNSDRLARWFQRLQSFEEPVTFCRTDNGAIVLSSASGDSDGDATQNVAQNANKDFTRLLAGYSRGIAGIAWAVWRQLLGVAATAEVEARVKETHGDSLGRLVYVRPWSGAHLRSLPAGTDLPDLFLLHALLIHGGLADRMLPEILPSGRSRLQSRLRKLAACGVVEEHQGYWQVTPLGYPPAREALESEGLFVDAF